MDRKGNAVFQIYLFDVKQINPVPTQILLVIILFFLLLVLLQTIQKI